jgi:hypothetical protein
MRVAISKGYGRDAPFNPTADELTCATGEEDYLPSKARIR